MTLQVVPNNKPFNISILNLPTIPNADAVLEIHGADIYRGANKVFEDLNLIVASGESTAIVGPNGAGKTTLLKLLAREIYPSKGEVKIFGRHRWNVWELRKQLGIVSADLQQNYSPSANGFSVVLSGFFSSVDTFGHQLFSHDQLETARRISKELEIEQFSDTRFSRMSTGEQRRHLLARALVNNPSTLVLDEPTTGLDLAGQVQYMARMRELIELGKSVVLVTHHIHEILPEIKHVVLLKEGQVQLSAPKKQALSGKNLSELFGVPLKVVSESGYFQVVPDDET